MIYIRCTQKLIKHYGLKPNIPEEAGDSILGDWYANIIPTDGGDLIVFLNERTLLTVAVPLCPENELFPTFVERVGNLLAMIDIPIHRIYRELEFYREILITKTKNRSLLGSLNDIAYHYQARAEMRAPNEKISLSDVELRGSNIPQKPLNWASASEVATDLLIKTETLGTA